VSAEERGEGSRSLRHTESPAGMAAVGSPMRSRETCEEEEEEGATERSGYGRTPAPRPHGSVCWGLRTGGGEAGNGGVQPSLGKLVGETGLVFAFVSHYLHLFYLAINYINFPQIESVLPVMVTGKRSSCPCLTPQVFPYFLPPSCDGGRARERLGGRLAAAKANPHLSEYVEWSGSSCRL